MGQDRLVYSLFLCFLKRLISTDLLNFYCKMAVVTVPREDQTFDLRI